MNTYSRPLPRKVIAKPETIKAEVKPVLPKATQLRLAAAMWQKWQMPRLGEETPEPEVAVQEEIVEAPQGPTPEEIEQARQAELKREIDEIKRKAYEQAYAEGLEAGLAAGMKQGYAQGHAEGQVKAQELASALTAERLNLLDTMANQANQQLRALEGKIAHGIITLAIQVAEHILGHELREPTEATFNTIKRVLSEHDEPDTLMTFWLHPEDLAQLREEICNLPVLSKIRLLADESVSRGGVRVQTPHGDIDATLQARWKSAIGSLGHTETVS